jgi:vacuolar-type H+-ATPase subunit D/Vma8
MRISAAFLPLAAAAILITGCGNKEPATNAVAMASESVENVRADATQYAPKELAAVDATLGRMKQNLAKEEYDAVMKDIPQINAEYKTVQEAAASMKTLSAAAQNEWQELSTEVPKTVQELDARVETLSGGKLPKEITKEAVASAKTELETMKATWAEATAAAAAGDTFAATDKGRSVQMKAEKLKDQLGIGSTVASL